MASEMAANGNSPCFLQAVLKFAIFLSPGMNTATIWYAVVPQYEGLVYRTLETYKFAFVGFIITHNPLVVQVVTDWLYNCRHFVLSQDRTKSPLKVM